MFNKLLKFLGKKLDKNWSDSIKVTGHIHFELFDEFGVLKETRDITNTVTTAGKTGIAAIVASGTTRPAWVELGTGTGGTTLLNAYILNSRTSSTISGSGALFTNSTTFAAGTGTGAITEAGMFDVATQNTANMWCYQTFSVINKGALDSLVCTWTVTFS